MGLFICFLSGVGIAFGFFVMSSFVMIIASGVYGWFNVATSLLLVFSLKVLVFHLVVISPALSGDGSGESTHNRFLCLLIGVWMVVIPYVEAESFAHYVKDSTWELGLKVSRLL